MKILVVEDDKTTRSMLEGMLHGWRYDCVTAETAEQGIALMADPEPPELVLMDWILPGMDGVEACRQIRERWPRRAIYILILTIKNNKQDLVEALDAGADDYLAKPFDRGELHARLNVGRRFVRMMVDERRHLTQIHDAGEHIRTLQGLLPVCMHCHKIRDDDETWQRIEEYIEAHSDLQFSHCLCNECQRKYSQRIGS